MAEFPSEQIQLVMQVQRAKEQAEAQRVAADERRQQTAVMNQSRAESAQDRRAQADFQRRVQEFQQRQAMMQVHNTLMGTAQRERDALVEQQNKAYTQRREQLNALGGMLDKAPQTGWDQRGVDKLMGDWKMASEYIKANEISDLGMAMSDQVLQKFLLQNPAMATYIPAIISGDMTEIIGRHPEWHKDPNWMANYKAGRVNPLDIVKGDIESKASNPGSLAGVSREAVFQALASLDPSKMGDPQAIAAARKRVEDLSRQDPMAMVRQAVTSAAPQEAGPTIVPPGPLATDRNGQQIPGIYEVGPSSYTNIPKLLMGGIKETSPGSGSYSNMGRYGPHSTTKAAPTVAGPPIADPVKQGVWSADATGELSAAPQDDLLKNVGFEMESEAHWRGPREEEIRQALGSMTPEDRQGFLTAHSLRTGLPLDILASTGKRLGFLEA